MSSQQQVVQSQSVHEPPPASASASRRPRCSHISRNRVLCRYSAQPGSDRCKYHRASPPSVQSDDVLADELLAAAGTLSSPADVNRLIRSVLQALLQRRLSTKEAGILCYIAQTSLRSQRDVARFQQLQAKPEAKAETESSSGVDEDDALIPHKLTWNLPPPAWVDAHPREYAAICRRIERLKRPEE